MKDLVVAFVTINKKKEAEALAQQIVEDRLAAGVSIIENIKSIYEWEGAIHNDEEFLLIIKTPKDKVATLKKFVHKHHSYEVPEFIVLDVVDALPDYIKWAYDVTA